MERKELENLLIGLKALTKFSTQTKLFEKKQSSRSGTIHNTANSIKVNSFLQDSAARKKRLFETGLLFTNIGLLPSERKIENLEKAFAKILQRCYKKTWDENQFFRKNANNRLTAWAKLITETEELVNKVITEEQMSEGSENRNEFLPYMLFINHSNWTLFEQPFWLAGNSIYDEKSVYSNQTNDDVTLVLVKNKGEK